MSRKRLGKLLHMDPLVLKQIESGAGIDPFRKAFPFGEGGFCSAVCAAKDGRGKNLSRRYAPPSPKGRALERSRPFPTAGEGFGTYHACSLQWNFS